MPLFRSLCPACSNMKLITWHHAGCPDYYYEYIDINGNISCDCGTRFHILDGEYNCQSNFHGIRYAPVVSKIRLRTIFSMLIKSYQYNDQFIDNLETNILREWDRRN